LWPVRVLRRADHNGRYRGEADRRLRPAYDREGSRAVRCLTAMSGCCAAVAVIGPVLANCRYRPILLKNSKMHPPHFLAKLESDCQLALRTAGRAIKRRLVARIRKSRLPPRVQISTKPHKASNLSGAPGNGTFQQNWPRPAVAPSPPKRPVKATIAGDSGRLHVSRQSERRRNA